MGEPQQILSDEGKFLKGNLCSFLEANGFSLVGVKYNVVAIIGRQSGGKSTLLNRVFGTNFEVMDARRGVQQTTQGLWVAADGRGTHTIILDVEGADSAERGGSRVFENRTAQFSLAVADLIIVNMWYNSIGCHEGANVPLLETVFSVHFAKFHQAESVKKTILVVVRDWEPGTPIDRLRESVMTNIRDIWKNARRVKTASNVEVDDVFKLMVLGIQHPLGRFQEDCEEFRTTWEREIKRPKYSRSIPAGAWDDFAENIWAEILLEKDLDVPKQEELVAYPRCKELADSAWNSVASDLKRLKDDASGGKFDFAEEFIELQNKAIDCYSEQAYGYHAGTVVVQQELLKKKFKESVGIIQLCCNSAIAEKKHAEERKRIEEEHAKRIQDKDKEFEEFKRAAEAHEEATEMKRVEKSHAEEMKVAHEKQMELLAERLQNASESSKRIEEEHAKRIQDKDKEFKRAAEAHEEEMKAAIRIAEKEHATTVSREALLRVLCHWVPPIWLIWRSSE